MLKDSPTPGCVEKKKQTSDLVQKNEINEMLCF